MKATHRFHLVNPTEVIIPADRQRQDLGDLDGLKDSIHRFGVLNPIIIHQDMRLIAGERRLRAVLELGWTSVPVHFFEELDPIDAQLIELAENVRRKQLSWQEECLAVHRVARLLETRKGAKIFMREVVDTIGSISESQVWRSIQVAKEIISGNEKILKASGFMAAANLISRQNVRKAESELSKLKDTDIFSESDDEPELPLEEESEDLLSLEKEAPTKVEPRPRAVDPNDLTEIVIGDFFDLVSTPRLKKFNFIHCDFPYGVGIDKSAQLNSAAKEAYEDTPDLYFSMLHAYLENADNFMADSCHIMFWFAMKHYGETLDAFIDSGFYINPYPLIWHKSDLRGIMPDAARGPRRTYETAFIAARGDRKIVKPVAGSHAAPTAKPQQHISQKPLPVLKHFFTMFVDGSSDMLDPTCGSGTALVAAEDSGAFSVEGWELNPDYAEVSKTNLRHYRTMQAAHLAIKEKKDGATKSGS